MLHEDAITGEIVDHTTVFRRRVERRMSTSAAPVASASASASPSTSPPPNFCIKLPDSPALCIVNSVMPTRSDDCLRYQCCWVASSRKCVDPAYNFVISGVLPLNPGDFIPTDNYIQLIKDSGFEVTVYFTYFGLSFSFDSFICLTFLTFCYRIRHPGVFPPIMALLHSGLKMP
jgi:hypothetical protein